MKQEVVARKAGLSDATLRKIETGLGPLNNGDIESICKALELNSDAAVLEASTALRYSLLEKLGRDPELSIYDQQDKIRDAARTRHEAELKELEAKLSWERFLYLKQRKFVNRE